MAAPWTVTRFRVERIAGYEAIEWSGTVPGTGKSTLLEAMVVALKYPSGKYERDLSTRPYPDATYCQTRRSSQVDRVP